jgi:hypothetical protein
MGLQQEADRVAYLDWAWRSGVFWRNLAGKALRKDDRDRCLRLAATYERMIANAELARARVHSD